MASLIKHMLLALMVFSIINLGFFNFMADLDNNYGENYKNQIGSNDDSYNNTFFLQIQNLTSELNQSITSGDITQGGGGVISGISDIILGGKIAANLFAVSIIGVPKLMLSAVTSGFKTMGIPGEFGTIILVVIFIIILFNLVKFIMGRVF